MQSCSEKKKDKSGPAKTVQQGNGRRSRNEQVVVQQGVEGRSKKWIGGWILNFLVTSCHKHLTYNEN
jgi:hypothetical protein